jgi:hypothetical protein
MTAKSEDRRRQGPERFASLSLVLLVLGTATCLVLPHPAHALSEIQREELPAPSETPGDEARPEQGVPAPDPVNPQAPSTETPDEQAPAEEQPPSEEPAPDDEQVPDEQTPDGTDNAASDPNAPLPDIQYDVSQLPEPVQRTRNLILEAAKTGDVEKLRPLLGTGGEQTQLSLGGIDGDPIAFLKEASGDDEGQEILAIMEEVLSSGYAHMEAGTANDFYVWPYFFAMPVDRLTPSQRVELFKIITAGDYEDMKTYGAYVFYRLGIKPDGKWSFFIAGD